MRRTFEPEQSLHPRLDFDRTSRYHPHERHLSMLQSRRRQQAVRFSRVFRFFPVSRFTRRSGPANSLRLKKPSVRVNEHELVRESLLQSFKASPTLRRCHPPPPIPPSPDASLRTDRPSLLWGWINDVKVRMEVELEEALLASMLAVPLGVTRTRGIDVGGGCAGHLQVGWFLVCWEWNGGDRP